MNARAETRGSRLHRRYYWIDSTQQPACITGCHAPASKKSKRSKRKADRRRSGTYTLTAAAARDPGRRKVENTEHRTVISVRVQQSCGDGLGAVPGRARERSEARTY